MEKYIAYLLHVSILFGRNVVGCFNSPYVTYRRLSKVNTDVGQTYFFPFLIIIYFSFATLIRSGLENPIILTINLNILLLSVFIGFFGMVFFIYIMGKIFRSKSQLKAIYTLWSYSLIPTLIWFFFTSMMYLFLPPPRTLAIWGKLYSLVFFTFSTSVFIWKVILYYLTLRFALRLDLLRILLVSMILTPIIMAYSLIMYKLGIFRIPFI